MNDKTREALKLALAAIRSAPAEQPAQQRPQNCGTGFCSCIECPYEQPAQQQEPVAWMCTETKILYDHDTSEVDKYHGFKPTMPLYAHPAPQPSKPWVGLTDDDIQEVRENCGVTHHAIKTIEAKLREKNA